MTRFWPVAVAVALFGGIGLAGLLRPAGLPPADAAVVQARLDALPLALGPWAGAAQPYPAKALRQAEAVASVNRVYTRADPPAQVGVLLLAGSPRALGAHDPAVCFAGAGFKPAGATGRRPAGVDSLWTGRYETAGVGPNTVDVCWGWSTGSRWEAPDDARFAFMGQGTIYKLYVTRGLPPGGGPPTRPDPTDEFLKLFLPATQALAGTTPAAP